MNLTIKELRDYLNQVPEEQLGQEIVSLNDNVWNGKSHNFMRTNGAVDRETLSIQLNCLKTVPLYPLEHEQKLKQTDPDARLSYQTSSIFHIKELPNARL